MESQQSSSKIKTDRNFRLAATPVPHNNNYNNNNNNYHHVNNKSAKHNISNNNESNSSEKSNHTAAANDAVAAMVSSVIKHEVLDVGYENKVVVVPTTTGARTGTGATATTILATSTANLKVLSSNSQIAGGVCLTASSGASALSNEAVAAAASTVAANSILNNSPKIGSRRIFTPQFKLQVLDSYRNDNDCKGNQRATARKYNIHRRQIQKWLQCEPNLRSSVANINQNTIKHQFHNISHQNIGHHHHSHSHPHQQQLSQSVAQQLQLANVTAPSSNKNHFSHHPHQSHPHHHPQQYPLSLGPARQSVSLNSVSVPSLQSSIVPPNVSAQGVLAAANLAAVVAAAAAAGATGAIAIVGTTSPNTSTTTVSPLRPTAIGGSSSATVSTSVLHPHQHPHHHHHHYANMPYTHTSVTVPVSVPILPHHISHGHLHHHYQYHSLSPHAHTLPQPKPQPQSQQQPTQSNPPSAFTPSACPPVNALSVATGTTAATASAATIVCTATRNSANASTVGGENKSNEKNYSQIPTSCDSGLRESAANSNPHTNAATTTTTIITPTAAATIAVALTGNSYADEDDYSYKSNVDGDEIKCEGKYKSLQQHYPYLQHSSDLGLAPMVPITMIAPITPMDLSLGTRRDINKGFNSDLMSSSDKLKDMTKRCKQMHETVDNNYNSVVDLTFRKRKVCVEQLTSEEHPEKLSKLSVADNNSLDTESIKTETDEKTDDSKANVEDDVDIEVVLEEKLPPSKPVKLFKPYLLDESEDDDEDEKLYKNKLALKASEQFIWSHQTGRVSPQSYEGRRDHNDSSSRGSNFQIATADKQTTFPIGSSFFPVNKSINPQSVLSSPSTQALSPTGFCIPKGSPVSGYESSSSTYSESSCKSESFTRNLSIDLQMRSAFKGSRINQQNHIQRWLDQETSTNPPAINASIALYA